MSAHMDDPRRLRADRAPVKRRPRGYVPGFDPLSSRVLLSTLGNGTESAAATPALYSSSADKVSAAADNLLTPDDVQQLLRRAAAASGSSDAIIAIVDRGGRILGVRVESGVDPALTADPNSFTFAVDGAIAKARTAAFFANGNAPLTSRTIFNLSQSTITQRMAESNPSITDEQSALRGPGYIAPIGLGAHFPNKVPYTPPVDLFLIEGTNRDTTFHPSTDRIKGTADDVELPNRFNIPDDIIAPDAVADFPAPPDSFGFVTGIAPEAAPRGIATLPGGLPIFKNGAVAGGIGIFFPGATGFATAENSRLNDYPIPSSLPDRSLEAEYIGIAALNGFNDPRLQAQFGPLDGVPPVAGIGLPFGTITLVGVTLDLYGPGGTQGFDRLLEAARGYGTGNADDGTDSVIQNGESHLAGKGVPTGNLVIPQNGVGGLTANDVSAIIQQGVEEGKRTRAAIRLPLNTAAQFVYAITDLDGNVIGLYRDPDATVFSLDVAVAKARNVTYYADPGKLQAADQVAGVPPGTAFTARTFRYLAGPRFPQSIDRRPPGPFSILNDGGANFTNGLNVGPPQPADAYTSVMGYDTFHPGTNFRDPTNILNQNGIIFFPGSTPLYKDVNGDGVKELVGGLGVSGDGVDQDDVVTYAASKGYRPPPNVRKADQTFVRGVRLPFMKFNRNPRL